MKIIYEDKDKLILEQPGRVNFLITALVFFASFIIPLHSLRLLITPIESFPTFVVILFHIISLFISLLIFILYGRLIAYLLDKYDLKERILVDRISRTVQLQKICKNRIISGNTYDFKNVKYVKIEAGSYDHLFVRLVTDRRKIRLYDGSLEETNDHRNKLALAHKLAEFIEVPVIEK